MALAEEIIEDDNEHKEAEELERLLEGSQSDGEEGAEGDEPTPEKAGRFAFSKKTWILVGGGTLLILLLAGGAYFFLSSSSQNPESEIQSGEQAGENVSTPPPVETVKSPFSKVHIYTLKPFFSSPERERKRNGEIYFRHSQPYFKQQHFG